MRTCVRHDDFMPSVEQETLGTSVTGKTSKGMKQIPGDVPLQGQKEGGYERQSLVPKPPPFKIRHAYTI